MRSCMPSSGVLAMEGSMRLRAVLQRIAGSVVVFGWALILSAGAGTLDFVHDPAGRLVSVIYGSQRSVTYQYDPAGSLLRLGPATGTADVDLDGMDDTWETQYFGSLGRSGAGDFDLDGASDLSEFLAGTVPNDSGSALLLLREISAEGVTTTVRWHSVPGRVYRLQFKAMLDEGPWQDVPGDVTAGGPFSEKKDTTASTASRFYRVQLIQAR